MTARTPTSLADRLMLTPREEELLELMSKGLPSELICREMFVANATLKSHLTSVFRKLGAHTRQEAITEYARRKGVCPTCGHEVTDDGC